VHSRGNDWGGYVALGIRLRLSDPGRTPDHSQRAASAVHLREISTNPAQIKASQYEREFNTAAGHIPFGTTTIGGSDQGAGSLEEGAAKTAPDLASHFFSGLGTPPATTSLR